MVTNESSYLCIKIFGAETLTLVILLNMLTDFRDELCQLNSWFTLSTKCFASIIMSLVSFLFPSRQQRWFEIPTNLIDFQVKCVPFSPISGRFGCKILERCLSKLSVANTGAEGRLCTLRLGKRFVVKANYNLAIKRNRKVTFCLLLPNSSFVENHSTH